MRVALLRGRARLEFPARVELRLARLRAGEAVVEAQRVREESIGEDVGEELERPMALGRRRAGDEGEENEHEEEAGQEDGAERQRLPHKGGRWRAGAGLARGDGRTGDEDERRHQDQRLLHQRDDGELGDPAHDGEHHLEDAECDGEDQQAGTKQAGLGDARLLDGHRVHEADADDRKRAPERRRQEIDEEGGGASAINEAVEDDCVDYVESSEADGRDDDADDRHEAGPRRRLARDEEAI